MARVHSAINRYLGFLPQLGNAHSPSPDLEVGGAGAGAGTSPPLQWVLGRSCMYPRLQSFCITACIFFQSQNTAEPFPRCVLSSLLSRGIWGCCAAPQQQRDPPRDLFLPHSQGWGSSPTMDGGKQGGPLHPGSPEGGLLRTEPARQEAPKRGGMECGVRTQKFLLGLWGPDIPQDGMDWRVQNLSEPLSEGLLLP